MVGRRGALGMEMGDGKSDGGIKVRSADVSRFRLVPSKLTMRALQLTASSAHLRGLIHLHMKATDLAKEAFMEALSRDVKCFESFEMLVGGEMMSSEEGTSPPRFISRFSHP